MLDLNSIHSRFSGNFSQQVDFFLGTLHQKQIVILSYTLSAISLLSLIGYILCKGLYQKKMLHKLNKKKLFEKEKYNENPSSKT
ncbi:hypothetical protein [Bartonella raoultii]|uniref:hypothetical protein n=1 Tax=Bartonella raoultii TaxID=1457020 RepID=UPI001FE57D96|nr:hypothetical protein [Bartonella raoultii]